MNLIEKAETLVKDLEGLKAIEAEVHNLKVFESRRDQLQTPVIQLESFIDILDALRKRSVFVELEIESLRNLRIHVETMREAFSEDPKRIVAKDKNASLKFWPTIENLPTKLGERLQDAWITYVTEKRHKDKEDFLDVLDGLPSFKKQVARIRKILAKMDQLGQSLPKDEDDFERLEKLSKSLETYWEDLEVEGIPDDVLQFIKQAGSGGVSLTGLTSSVLSWLEKNKLKDVFVVTISRQG
jgi:hypothetical protein